MDLRIWHLATLELLLLQPRQEMKNLRIINSTGIFHPAFKVRNNGMLRHSLRGAVILFSLHLFIASALNLMPCLHSGQRREAIKAINPRREQ